MKRTIKAGFQGFYRNRIVSLSSIFILTLTLCVVMGLSIAHYVFAYTLDSVKDKVDIRIYMKPDATDDDIANILNVIKSISNVRSTMLESKADALSKFRDEHKDDKATLIALEEIGDNPFGASISVQAMDTTHYEDIVKTIKKYADNNVIQNGSNAIDHINYEELKVSIDKINTILALVDKVGLWTSAVFITMSFLIVYNTTRLAIYTFREEINIMKLVGASNFFVRGPFIVEAVLYAIIASSITMILYYPFSVWLTNKTLNFLEGLSIVEYYKLNFVNSFGLLLATGIVVTSISSFFAVRKYLKV